MGELGRLLGEIGDPIGARGKVRLHRRRQLEPTAGEWVLRSVQADPREPEGGLEPQLVIPRSLGAEEGAVVGVGRVVGGAQSKLGVAKTESGLGHQRRPGYCIGSRGGDARRFQARPRLTQAAKGRRAVELGPNARHQLAGRRSSAHRSRRQSAEAALGRGQRVGGGRRVLGDGRVGRGERGEQPLKLSQPAAQALLPREQSGSLVCVARATDLGAQGSPANRPLVEGRLDPLPCLAPRLAKSGKSRGEVPSSLGLPDAIEWSARPAAERDPLAPNLEHARTQGDCRYAHPDQPAAARARRISSQLSEQRAHRRVAVFGARRKTASDHCP